MLTVCVFEPAAQTDNSLGVSEQHLPSFTQTLLDLRRQPRRVQEDTASDFGMVTIKPIPHDVNRGNAGANILGAYGYSPYFPAVLNFQAQFILAVTYDFAHSLFQITLARSYQ